MATKMSPEQLREQADRLLKQAAEEETRRLQLLGKLVFEFIKDDFKQFDLERFKRQSKELWVNGKIKPQPKKAPDKPVKAVAVAQ